MTFFINRPEPPDPNAPREFPPDSPAGRIQRTIEQNRQDAQIIYGHVGVGKPVPVDRPAFASSNFQTSPEHAGPPIVEAAAAEVQRDDSAALEEYSRLLIAEATDQNVARLRELAKHLGRDAARMRRDAARIREHEELVATLAAARKASEGDEDEWVKAADRLRQIPEEIRALERERTHLVAECTRRQIRLDTVTTTEAKIRDIRRRHKDLFN